VKWRVHMVHRSWVPGCRRERVSGIVMGWCGETVRGPAFCGESARRGPRPDIPLRLDQEHVLTR
jgi:hypothetical protein